MPNRVTRDKLVRIVSVWGKSKPERYVEQLVAEGLIPPAQPHGLGRGKGLDWFYPTRTDGAVWSALRFRERGLRGDALHFAMWWSGQMVHSPRVSRFASSVYAAAPGLIRSRLMHLAQRSTGGPELESIESRSEGDLSATDLIEFELEKLFQSKRSPGIQAMMETLYQLASVQPEGELIEIVARFAASSLGLDQADSGHSDDRLMSSGIGGPGAAPDPASAAIAAWLEELGSGGGYERLLRLIAEAPAGLYDFSRYLLRRNAQHRSFIREVAKWTHLINDKISDRHRDRLGPWRQPAVALRATMVGTLVWYYFRRIGRAYRIIEEEQTQ